jgi:hypothetical protein
MWNNKFHLHKKEFENSEIFIQKRFRIVISMAKAESFGGFIVLIMVCAGLFCR